MVMRNFDGPRTLIVTVVSGHQTIGHYDVANLELIRQRAGYPGQNNQVNDGHFVHNTMCTFLRPAHSDPARGQRNLRGAETAVAALQALDAERLFDLKQSTERIQFSAERTENQN